MSYITNPPCIADSKHPIIEPSSVLASRIIRAHDNPSPPPRAQHLPSFAPSPLKDASFPVIDSSESPDVDIPNTDIGLQYNTMFNRPASPPSPSNGMLPLPLLTLREASLSPPPSDSAANTQQHDLISFESFCSPSGFPGQPESITTAPFTTTLQSSTGSTVDDLLLRSPTVSPSPRRPTTPVAFKSDTMMGALYPRSISPLRRSPRLSPAYEPTSDDGHTMPCEYPSTSPPPPAPPVTPLPKLEEPEPRTPRQSPRRSSTPQTLKSVPATPEPSIPLGAQAPLQSQFETPLVVGALHQFAESPTGAQARKKRWKGKAKATSPGDEAVDDSHEVSRDGSAETGETEIKTEIREGKEKRQQENSRGKLRMQRELGSLSPRSASVLEQLHPSIETTLAVDARPVEGGESAEQDPDPQVPSTSIFSSHFNPLLTSVKRPPPGTPVRFTSPTRGPSPTKLVTGLDPDNSTRTPARRIPIRQAIAQGTPLAQRLGCRENAFAAALRTPVFTRPALDDPQRSPARRIPISEAISSAKKVPTTKYVSRSPVRGVSRERSGSAEPRPRTERERSSSVEHQRPMRLPSSSSSRPAPKLPFPLIATSEHDRPTTIPEESEALSSPCVETPPESTSAPVSTSPTKSSLKQPSSSKIPRIGTKPYARLKTSAKEKESKSSVLSRKANVDSVAFSGIVRILFNLYTFRLLDNIFFFPIQTKSDRVIHSVAGNGGSSDDINTGSNGTKVTNDAPTSTNLKRKRGIEKPSPAQTRPLVIRQVIPGILGPKYAPATHPAPRPSTKEHAPTQAEASPVKKAHRPLAMRRVVDKHPQKSATRSQVTEMVVDLDIPDEEPAGKEHDDDGTVIMVSFSRTAEEDTTPLSSPVLLKETAQSPQNIDDSATSERQNSVATLTEDDTEPLIKVRRTTRSRKTVLPANDVFTASSTRPLHSRRKAPASSRSDADGFSGLSSVALKALTSSNTVKNQQNFVSLATEVIRKDGRRPESPVMKVRTISQRQADERAKGRSERAHRRARRSDDGMSDTEGFSSDRGDSSMMEGEGDFEEDVEDSPHKHRRGPGEEEDYETPARPDKPSKRPRFEDEKEDIQEKKRVKWDRGLYSEIYLDQIEVRSGKRPTEHIIKKGCLAPTAKVGG